MTKSRPSDSGGDASWSIATSSMRRRGHHAAEPFKPTVQWAALVFRSDTHSSSSHPIFILAISPVDRCHSGIPCRPNFHLIALAQVRVPLSFIRPSICFEDIIVFITGVGLEGTDGAAGVVLGGGVGSQA